MAYLNEIKEAINICKKKQNKIAVLKCTSIYPAPTNSLNLKSISELKNFFKIPIGYSDHAKGISAAVFSIGIGAKIIEKHFTLNKNQKGADHKISIEPYEFKKMVKNIRELEEMLGKIHLKPTINEIKKRNVVYRKIVSLSEIKKNEKVSYKNIGFKRINSNKKGISPKLYFKIQNKKAKKNIKNNQVISLKDFR